MRITRVQSSPQTPVYYGKAAKRRFIWGGVRVGTNSLLLIPTTVVLARLLTPSEFGVAAAALFFLQLASRLTQFGFGVSLVRLKIVRPDHVDSVFVVTLLLGLGAWAAIAGAAPLIGQFLQSRETAAVLPVGGFGFVLAAAGAVPTALLNRGLRARESAISDWMGTFANSVVAIALAWRGFSYWSVIYGHLANLAVTACVRMWMVGWVPRLRFSRTAMGELFSFGAGIYAKNLLDYMAHNVDNLIVGRLLGVASLGFYDKAFGLTSRLLNHINLSGPAVSFRVFALIHEDHARFQRAYRKVILGVALVGYPILTAMIVTAPELIEVLFGVRWLPSVLPFQILCAAGVCKLLNTYASTATQAKGMIWSEVKRQAGFTVVLVAAVAALCRFGIAGAAAGVLVATATSTVLMQSLVRRLAGLTWSDMLAPQLAGVVCSVQLAAALMATRAVLHVWTSDPAPAVVLLASLPVAACSYLAFLLFAPIGELREFLAETVEDLAPALARRVPFVVAAKKVAYLGQ